jgi:hypothetical protein
MMCRLLPLLALLLAACTGDVGNCTRLPGGERYCLVDGPWPEFAAEQAVTVTYAGKPLHLIARIQSGKDGLYFAGLTPLGQTLIQVSWKNGLLHAELPPAFAGRLDEALFPALLQLATWPAERVRAGLPDRLRLIEKEGQRIVSDGLQDVLIISWKGNALPYEWLRFEAPAARMLIDVRLLDEAVAP